MSIRSQGRVRNRNRRSFRFESLEDRRLMAIDFFNAAISDASGDTTEQTVFQDGALYARTSLQIPANESLASVRVQATNGRGTWVLESEVFDTSQSKVSDAFFEALVDLSDQTLIPAGRYAMQIEVQSSTGERSLSPATNIRILNTSQIDGTFKAELFDLSEALIPANTGIVLHGQGGTDTMHLASLLNDVVTINGQSVKRFDSEQTDALPVHQGYAVDHLVLSNGSEVYFTGIDRIAGPKGKSSPWATSVDLSVRPNDPEFPNQWNLHVSDVPSAWRFTTGSEDVLLVSLDTGVLPRDEPVHVFGKVTDLSTERLITEPLNAVEAASFASREYGHGHMSVSVMSGTPNNGQFVAGINWESDVLVANVYSFPSDLQTAIRTALEYGRQAGKKIVFQGGIQGEGWLNSGGTQAELESLIASSENDAVFAVAAGNAGIPVEQIPSAADADESGGVARLQSSHPNLMAVGALQSTSMRTQGLLNAIDVHRADYSNHGQELTLMGATDSPATDQFTDIPQPRIPIATPGIRSFGGTSAANPNIAGIASLVWSVNNRLTGSQIREILTDTAMDNLPNGDGHSFLNGGKDYEYGHGLANADLAVRRALAMRLNPTLVDLVSRDNVLEGYTGKRFAAVDPSSTSQKASFHDDAILQYAYQLPNASETLRSKAPLQVEQPSEQVNAKRLTSSKVGATESAATKDNETTDALDQALRLLMDGDLLLNQKV